MKKITLYPYRSPQFLQNRIFKLDIFKELKETLHKKNVEINTVDLSNLDKSDLIVHFDVPLPYKLQEFKLLKKNTSKSILFCFEPPIVNPFNYMKPLHVFFKKVYTWHDDLVDNQKYLKFYWPQSSNGLHTKKISFKDKKLLILMNGNKLPFAPFSIISSFGKELYSERIKAIEYFENSGQNIFDLYGRGWNQKKKLNLKESLIGYKKYKNYKGEVSDKLAVMSKYKFSICFENLTNVNGYITEKIFDSLKARCVPIYWGASNIYEYIPKGCFIDYRNFNSYKNLQLFLENMTEPEYRKYIENIEKFLRSEKIKNMWLEKPFIDIFLKEIKSV